jgi:outer membrane protein insertion porin family
MRIFSFVFLAMYLSTFAVFAATVKEIRITGTQRIEPSTVQSYFTLQPGDEATQEALDESLKNLFATGLFADVQLSESQGVVLVRVVENPIVNLIEFEGNDEVKDADLLNEVSLRPRQVFTRTKVQNDVARIYDIYRRDGYYSANVEPKIIQLDQNRINLVFEITEGPITEISKIRFVGNQRYNDQELRGVLTTQEYRWYNFLSSNDRYDQDRLSFDQELLRQFYLRNGYADFRILSSVAELSQDKKDFFLTITLEEGPRYKMGDAKINAELRDLDPKRLLKAITYRRGQWYNADEIKNTTEEMTKVLGDLQYAFVSVTPEVTRNAETRTIDIVYNIGESPRVFVDRINIAGNLATRDKVIRRQFELSEGDPFNRTKLAKSEQKIKDLGYFEKVEVKTSPGTAPDKSVIDVAVQEKSTGELSVGAGFSTADGPLADFGIRERNFLGKGQELQLSGTIAGKRTEFDVSFTEPFFLDRDLSAGIDAFHTTRDQQEDSSFDQKRTGGGFRVGFPLSDKLRQTWRYRFENNQIENIDSDASRFIKDQKGKRTTSAISQRLVFENLDSTLWPTEGIRTWLDTELAGLSGDAQYVSGKVGGAYYYPIAKNWVFNVLGETGAIEGWGDETVRINERFFIGSSTLRGFTRAGIGPRDISTDDALGGNVFYRGSAELSFPIGFPEDMGVAGHAFTDFGSLWKVDLANSADIADSESLRAAAGLGFSWRSPFGPLRIDLAQPYIKEDYDETEFFRFSFGTRF